MRARVREGCWAASAHCGLRPRGFYFFLLFLFFSHLFYLFIFCSLFRFNYQTNFVEYKNWHIIIGSYNGVAHKVSKHFEKDKYLFIFKW